MHNLNALQMKVAGDGNIDLLFGKLDSLFLIVYKFHLLIGDGK